MKKYILLLLFITASQFVLATPQLPNYLIYNGVTYRWDGGWVGYKLIEDTKLPTPAGAAETSATNRVIWLTYTIEKNKLYLTDVESFVEDGFVDEELKIKDIKVKSFFSYYFPNQDKILIADINGVIIIPFGETEEDEYCWIKHEKYHLFYFKHGSLKKIHSVNYIGLKLLKRKAFNKFKKSKRYNALKQEVIETENLSFFNEYSCNKATIDDYIEYFVFSRGYVNKI